MAPLLKTQALVVHEVGKPFQLQDVYIDEASLDPEQALVDFKVTGICHTDISTQDGTFPHSLPAILGHEGAGTVRKLPSGYSGSLSIGDSVLCSFDACGKHCTSCNTGYPAACHSFFPRIFWGLRQDGTTTDCYADEQMKDKINMGFFGQSSFMKTGIVNLGSMIKIDQDLPLHLICAFGCGIMTGFGTVINKLLPSPEKSFSHLPDYESLNLPKPTNITDSSPKTIVIIGMGAVGMGAVVGARVAKVANIIAVDMVEDRLTLAKEAGATHTLNGKLTTEELTEAVKKISPDGAGANMSLEASGSGKGLENAIACLAPMGKCAGVGAPKPGLTIEIDMNTMVATNRTYMGVLLGDAITPVLLPYMVALFKRGDFAIMEKLVTTYKPEDMEKAVADSKSGKVVKPVIAW